MELTVSAGILEKGSAYIIQEKGQRLRSFFLYHPGLRHTVYCLILIQHFRMILFFNLDIRQ
jgi:hypothetical protein